MAWKVNQVSPEYMYHKINFKTFQIKTKVNKTFNLVLIQYKGKKQISFHKEQANIKYRSHNLVTSLIKTNLITTCETHMNATLVINLILTTLEEIKLCGWKQEHILIEHICIKLEIKLLSKDLKNVFQEKTITILL